MDYQKLQELGLTKSEILVYIALLKLGESSTGKIIEKADISSGKIYEILERLIDKGLVSFIVKNNVKHFRASPPSKIKEYLLKKKIDFEKKTKEIEEMIPNLEAIAKGRLPEYDVQVFEEVEGIKSALMYLIDNMEKGDDYLAIGVGLKNSGESIQIFYHQIERLFRKKKIRRRFIIMDPSKETMNYLKSFRAEVRKLPGFNLAPFAISDDFLMLFNFVDMNVIVIRNMILANQFRFLFESLWKIAKK